MTEDYEVRLEEYPYEDVQEIIDKGHEVGVILYCDFNMIINENGTLTLIDLQGADLGGICSEEFDDYEDILNRLEGSYLQDYGLMDY